MVVMKFIQKHKIVIFVVCSMIITLLTLYLFTIKNHSVINKNVISNATESSKIENRASAITNSTLSSSVEKASSDVNTGKLDLPVVKGAKMVDLSKFLGDEINGITVTSLDNNRLMLYAHKTTSNLELNYIYNIAENTCFALTIKSTQKDIK